MLEQYNHATAMYTWFLVPPLLSFEAALLPINT